jgi:hypothetical protein
MIRAKRRGPIITRRTPTITPEQKPVRKPSHVFPGPRTGWSSLKVRPPSIGCRNLISLAKTAKPFAIYAGKIYQKPRSRKIG